MSSSTTSPAKLPAPIGLWSWGNGLCVLAFVVVGVVTPIYLPVVLIVLLAAGLQIAIGLQLAFNWGGLSDRWAAWGRGRSALVGFGSRSPEVNRLQGILSVAVGVALIAAAGWLAVTFRPLI